MSHMQAQIEHGEWYEVSANGETTWVPADVVGLAFLDVEAGKVDGATLVKKLQPYVEGTIDEDDGAAVVQAKRGFGARLSAPGYTDCTEWCVFETEQGALDYLAESHDIPQCTLCRNLLTTDVDDDCEGNEFCEACGVDVDGSVVGNPSWTHPTFGEPVRVAHFENGRAVLILWDGKSQDSAGRHCVQFRLTWDGKPLFDVDAGPFHGHVAIDGDMAIVGVMGLLTLKPGDTDADYFEKYTAAQLDWAKSHAESVQVEVMARYGED